MQYFLKFKIKSKMITINSQYVGVPPIVEMQFLWSEHVRELMGMVEWSVCAELWS